MKAAQDDYSRGEYAQAEMKLKKALRKAQGVSDMVNVFAIQVFLRRISLAEFKYDQAKSYLYSVVSYSDPGVKPSDTEMAEALNSLAIIYTQTGQNDKASSYFKRALALKQKMDPKQANVAGTLSGMGDLELREGHYKEALKYLLQAKELSIKTSGLEHPDTAKILCDLGQAYQFLNQLSDADAAYKQSLSIRQKTLNPGDPAVADSEMVMGSLAFRKGDYAGSEKLFKSALAIDEHAFGQNNVAVGEIYFVLGVLYQKQNMLDKAVESYSRSYAIRSKVLDPKDPKLKRTKELLQSAQRRLRQIQISAPVASFARYGSVAAARYAECRSQPPSAALRSPPLHRHDCVSEDVFSHQGSPLV